MCLFVVAVCFSLVATSPAITPGGATIPPDGDLREMVQHLSNRVILLTEKVDTLADKNSRLEEGFKVLQGQVPKQLSVNISHGESGDSEFLRKARDLSLDIQSQLQQLITSFSSVPVMQQRSGVCVWELGLVTPPRYLPQLNPFTSVTGSSALICKPDEEGWLTILRRDNPYVDFARGWEEYKYGFGDPAGSFWLGNELIHQVTRDGHYKLHVALTDWSGEVKYATYSWFKLGRESDKYRLNVSGYNGTAGDSFIYHNDMQFSTHDQDNDKTSDSCSKSHGGGGWWFNACDNACLTGIYFPQGTVNEAGVEWTKAYNDARSFKTAVMKIRSHFTK